MLARRGFLAIACAGAAGCGRKKGTRFDGYAFVANQEGKAVAAVDLAAFAVARHIPVDGEPSSVIASTARPPVYVLCPAEGLIHEISAERLERTRRVHLNAGCLSFRLSRDEAALWVLARAPHQLIRVDTATLRADRRIPLPAEPLDFDLAPDGDRVAISFAGFSQIQDLSHGKGTPRVIPGEGGRVRFRPDGRMVILAHPQGRMLTLADAATGRVVVKLPLALSPRQMCFNADGGQLFVTGEAMDGVVIVYPYNVPQVAGTVLAGKAPGAMAASAAPPYLFVANPLSNTVTILDISTQKVLAAVQVGAEPGFIGITPDNQYALVLNRQSGDMSVIRIGALGNITAPMRRMKSAPLFTMIPVGSRPVSAAVRQI